MTFTGTVGDVHLLLVHLYTPLFIYINFGLIQLNEGVQASNTSAKSSSQYLSSITPDVSLHDASDVIGHLLLPVEFFYELTSCLE